MREKRRVLVSTERAGAEWGDESVAAADEAGGGIDGTRLPFTLNSKRERERSR